MIIARMKYLSLFIFIALLGTGCLTLDSTFQNQANDAVQNTVVSDTPFTPRVESFVYENHQYQATIFKLNNKTTQWKLSHSTEPKRIEDWADELDADFVVNGNFFTEENEPTGLFRLDGQVISDAPYTSTTVGSVHLRNGSFSLVNSEKKPTSGDLFQSYPLLIRPDGKTAVEEDTEKIARRTILAQDDHDYTYIILFDSTPLSLYTASIILPRLLPELTWALNLDGGPSTGAVYKTSDGRKHILPATELPIVLSAKMASPALPNGQ